MSEEENKSLLKDHLAVEDGIGNARSLRQGGCECFITVKWSIRSKH